MNAPTCEPMIAGEDGWSEWIHPLPGYLMQCCDCGLIHDAEFQIGERDGDGPLNPGEGDEVIIFRMRRHAVQPEPERPSPEDLANKAEREAAYWRERCEALDATLIKAIAWINNQGFMFGCVVEDLNRERLAENITPDAANP